MRRHRGALSGFRAAREPVLKDSTMNARKSIKSPWLAVVLFGLGGPHDARYAGSGRAFARAGMIHLNFDRMKYVLPACMALLMAGCAANPWSHQDIEAKKIWDKAPHNAFTDLIRFNDAFYCVFREGKSHVSGPTGVARVLRSADGDTWQSLDSFELEGMDVRDPKISVTPDQRLMILMDGEGYENGKVATRKPYVSFSDSAGTHFSAPALCRIDSSVAVASDWVWRITWHDRTGYGIDYQPGGIYLVSTADGQSFQGVSRIPVDGTPNESTIRFDPSGKMYVLVRREGGDKMGVIATSTAPYKDWTLHKMDKRLGGPDFLFLNDTTLVIGTRGYPAPGQAGGAKTVLYVTDLQGDVRKTIELPSGGDTSYPGLLIFGDKLWVSYYSSHEGRTSIYLAKVPLSELQ